MQNIKVIIGASYGDEGKGLAADFFGAQEKEKNGAVNVLTNGGPQRGHTVELADGRRHVFKHFGAATFRGAAAYYAQQFLVNPMEFLREFDELSGLYWAPEAYMHPQCRFTTPWDMLANQMLREMQGLHNSCGFGIWETVLRYQRGFGLSFESFTSMSREDRLRWLRQLRDGCFRIYRRNEMQQVYIRKKRMGLGDRLARYTMHYQKSICKIQGTGSVDHSHGQCKKSYAGNRQADAGPDIRDKLIHKKTESDYDKILLGIKQQHGKRRFNIFPAGDPSSCLNEKHKDQKRYSQCIRYCVNISVSPCAGDGK